MKVLFVYPNLTGQLQTPLGLPILSAVLKQKGHNTMLFDTTWGYDKEKLSKLIKEFKPGVIAFSSRNCDYYFALSIAKDIKQKQNIPIVFGGPQATLSPEKLIRQDCIDFVCIGEGEYALAELAEKLEKKKDTSRIKNIWAKKNGKIFRNELRPLIQNLDELPFPDWEVLDKRHLTGKFALLFMTSRGCPHHCTYCANHAFQKTFAGKGKYIRFQSPQRVIEEIKDARKKLNFDTITFTDEMFTVNKERVKEICRLYKKEIGLPFMIETRADGVDKETLQALRDAGCETVGMGIEEGNDFIRNNITKRNMKRETLVRAFKEAKEAGLKTYSMNMVGLPFETKETIFETIELNRMCKPDGIQVSFFAPYEGTELRELCEKNGWIREEPIGDFYTSTVLEQPSISSASVDAFHKTFILYCFSPKPLFFVIDILRFFLEKLPGKARDKIGQPVFRFGQIAGLVRRYGFFATFKNIIKPMLYATNKD